MQTSSYGPVPISSIYLGERVKTAVDDGNDPGVPAAATDTPTAVDPATWREVDFSMPDPQTPGDNYLMHLLEPLSWITANKGAVGNWVELSLPELQVQGLAQVTAVTSCPAIESGGGHVVLGTFEHISDDILDVNLVGQNQPLKVTSGHKLWSLDRDGWVKAGDLHDGERLAGGNGPVVVESVTPDDTPEAVYNLDVETDHRYLVTSAGVLVHNASPCGAVSSSGILTVVDRAGMECEIVTASNGKKLTVWGQVGNSSSTTPGHAEAMLNWVQRLAATGKYAYVTLQRSWRTATGLGGKTSRNIPDIIAVTTEGKTCAWEVPSATDTEGELLARLREGMDTLPKDAQGDIGIVPAAP